MRKVTMYAQTIISLAFFKFLNCLLHANIVQITLSLAAHWLLLEASHSPWWHSRGKKKQCNLNKVKAEGAQHILKSTTLWPQSLITWPPASGLELKKSRNMVKADVFFPYQFAMGRLSSSFCPKFFICKFQQFIYQNAVATHYLNVFIVLWKKCYTNITEPFKKYVSVVT